MNDLIPIGIILLVIYFTLKLVSDKNVDEAIEDGNVEDLECPVCGYYCLGNGVFGCIDKLGYIKKLCKKINKGEKL